MTSNTGILDSIRQYTSHLEAKNEALAELSRISASLGCALEQDDSAGVNSILLDREESCKRLMKLCARDNGALVDVARRLATSSKDEVGQAARLLLAVNSRCESLSEDVLTCQQRCEAILKTQLESTSLALRESVQRRKLNAAYGPACRHDTPTFMDKQT